MRLTLGLALGTSASLALGCTEAPPPVGETPADTTTTGGSTTTGPAATTTTATPASSTDGGSGDSTAANSIGSSGGGDSSSGAAESSSSGGGDSSGTTGSSGGPEQDCMAGCAIEFMCGDMWMSEDACTSWCLANLDKAEAFSPFCAAAWQDVSACLGTLTCEEFAVWDDPIKVPYPCFDEDVILEIECKGQ